MFASHCQLLASAWPFKRPTNIDDSFIMLALTLNIFMLVPTVPCRNSTPQNISFNLTSVKNETKVSCLLLPSLLLRERHFLLQSLSYLERDVSTAKIHFFFKSWLFFSKNISFYTDFLF